MVHFTTSISHIYRLLDRRFFYDYGNYDVDGSGEYALTASFLATMAPSKEADDEDVETTTELLEVKKERINFPETWIWRDIQLE